MYVHVCTYKQGWVSGMGGEWSWGIIASGTFPKLERAEGLLCTRALSFRSKALVRLRERA
jgi:hypothetical protein